MDTVFQEWRSKAIARSLFFFGAIASKAFGVPHHAGPYVPDIPGPRDTESSRLEKAIGRILKVEPVGTAMKDSYERYATVQAGQVYGRVLQVGGDRCHQS